MKIALRPAFYPIGSRALCRTGRPAAGDRDDSYENALAETINGLYKAEMIDRRAPWKTHESVELKTTQQYRCRAPINQANQPLRFPGQLSRPTPIAVTLTEPRDSRELTGRYCRALLVEQSACTKHRRLACPLLCIPDQPDEGRRGRCRGLRGHWLLRRY